MRSNLDEIAEKAVQAQLMQFNGDFNGVLHYILDEILENHGIIDAELRNIIGLSYSKLGSYHLAKTHFTNTLKLVGDQDNDPAKVQMSLARTYLGDLCRVVDINYHGALNQHNIAIEVAPENTVALARAHLYKGFLMTDWERPDEALECYINAYNNSLKAQDSVEAIRELEKLKSLRAVGQGLMDTKKFKKAKQIFQHVVKKSWNKCPQIAGDALINIGNIGIQEKKYEKAIPWLNNAYFYQRKSGNNKGMSRALLGLTEAFAMNYDFPRATKTFKKYKEHPLPATDTSIFREQEKRVEKYMSHLEING